MQSFGPGTSLYNWYIGVVFAVKQRPKQARNVMSIENAMDKHQRSSFTGRLHPAQGSLHRSSQRDIVRIVRYLSYPYPDRSSWFVGKKSSELNGGFSVTCFHFHMWMQLARTILDGEPQKLGVRFDELRHPVFVKKIAVLGPRYGRKTLEI